MLGCPSTKTKSFDIGIYNKKVRKLVSKSQSHDLFDDQWSDVHYYTVYASNEGEARSIADERFPPNQGFVIDGVRTA